VAAAETSSAAVNIDFQLRMTFSLRGIGSDRWFSISLCFPEISFAKCS
jgi:hypothetical protein